MDMNYHIFVASAPGMEALTAQEMRTLEISAGHATQVEGGIEFTGNLPEIYRANLLLRTAGRVLVRLGKFHAAAFSELRKKGARLPWETYLQPGQPVALRATCHRSRLYHSDAVVERLVGAIGDRLGTPPELVTGDTEEMEQPPQIIHARLVNNVCTISVDASGAHLHRRGYRLATAKAPLRETLAAGLVLASGWDGHAPLLDPFCGAGTIAIEAALWARNHAPGRERHFAFMDWPGFVADMWETTLAAAQAAEQPISGPLFASDRDAGAIRAAEANTARASVTDSIAFTCQAVSAIAPPPGPGWIVTNPPYGVRVSANHDLRNLYAQFGHVLRARCSGWHVALLCSDSRLIQQTGLRLETTHTWLNGGLRVHVAQGMVE